MVIVCEEWRKGGKGREGGGSSLQVRQGVIKVDFYTGNVILRTVFHVSSGKSVE